MANFSDLPAEVILLIFQFYVETEGHENLLLHVSRVSLYWKQICMDSALWTKYDGTLSYKKMMSLCKNRCFINTKELTISETKRLTLSDAETLFSNSKNIEVINLSYVASFDKHTFSVISGNCSRLKEVHIENQQKNRISLTYSLLGSFFVERGQGLVALRLSHCNIASVQLVIRCIADCCPNIEELHLRNILCAKGVFPTEYFQKRCSKLKILHLDQYIRISERKDSSGFPNLEVFTYIDARGYIITDRGFECIVFNSPNLKFLNLTYCSISAEVLHGLPACSVEYLYIARSNIINSRYLNEVLCKWCHTLKELDLSYSGDFSVNRALLNLVRTPSECPIEILNLNFTQVIASVVQEIIQTCRQLEVLHLEGCRNLERGMKKTYREKSELNSLSKKLETFISTNPTVHNPIMLP